MTAYKRVLLTTSAAPSQSPFSTIEKRPPIGIGFLISVLRNAGHEVFFIDNYLEPSDSLETDYLQFNHIDLVGIYANTICYRDTLRMLHRLEYLRQTGKWKGKIVVGGPHTTVALDTIPEFVDHVVQGEGEYALLDIVEGKATQRVIRYPRIQNLDELPMPAWDYFALLPYNWHVEWFPEEPVFTMNTSRGCPFACTFCSVGSVWGKNYTYFSAERIVSDIEYLVEHHGAKGIYFREDNFTLNKNRLTRYCNLLLERGITIPWACETRVSSLDRETVELMSRAGVCGFYLGVESGSQRMLDFLMKGITVDQTRNAFELCHEYSIKTAASVIVGTPTETDEDLQQTLTLLDDIKPTTTWFNVFVGIPNSYLYQYTINNNLYEFKDDRGLLYLKGHNKRTKKYYGKHINAEIPAISSQGDRIVKPKISVVMSVYNGDKYLEKAIQSILHQSFQDFEFIIIDDASTDSTTDILARFTDPRFKIMRNHRNIGLTRSLNIGMREAQGEYIARMDADDISLPHRLETQYEFLRNNPEYALVGSSYYSIDENGRTVSLVPVLTSDQEIRAGLQKQNWFGHGTVMMRNNTFVECGGYDEEFIYAQDYDLWLRMTEKFKVSNIEEPLYCWRITSDCISKKKINEQQKYARLAIFKTRSRLNLSLKKPKVSVIVPTYNRPQMLIDAIQSILDQSYKNVEIVVINDCGTDVKEIVRGLNIRNNIIYLNHHTNKGLAASRNTGIKAASGKYIAYLDDDDIYYPNHLETLVNVIEEGKYKVAYTDAYRAFQVLENGHYRITRRDIPFSNDFDRDLLLIQNISPVNCFVHAKSCLDEVGLFDEDLHAHEDWDLWIRLSREYDFKHIRKVTAEFRWRMDGSTMSSSRLPEFLRTMGIIYRRYNRYAQGKPEILNNQREKLGNLEQLVARQANTFRCSIIIPVFNQVDYTRQCLAALIEHTPSELYEVIIVDNGSTDGTGNFLATLEGDVKLITNAQNRGFSKACNQGAQAAAGAYLVFLNNDTVPHEHWLTELIDVADALDDVAVVGSKLLYPDGTIQHAGVVTPPDHLYHFMRGNFPPANKPRDFQIVTAACLLIRRDIFLALGGFDETFINGGEDVDLCLKIREHGYRVFYNPRSVLTHYESVSEGRHNHLQHNLDLLEKRYAQTVKLDREDYLKQDGFVLEERDGEPLWVYHEDLCRKTISVVIVTYNSRPYIRECLASIQTQTNLSFEIIIIDNNSIDGTRGYLKDLQGFKVILNDENAGFSRACNQGIRAASGDYIVLLNPDTAVTHDWAWRLLLHFKPGIGAVGPVSNHAAGLQLSRHYQRAKLGEADINAIAERFYAWNKGKGMETKLLTGFCLMLKRSAIEETGLLDEDLFLGSEDLEYSLRLRLKGYRLVVATDVFIYHKGQADFPAVLPEQTRRITREGQDKLYAKLETHYGKGKVPSSTELWNMDWFRPSQITKPPLTSIIILTFNQIEYTKACLASIVDHTQAPYEIILVDNGSTDGTRAFLVDYAKTHAQCAVILNDENRGFAGGNNQGIEKAQGDYILLLNNDVLVTQGWLARLIAHMETYPDIGMLGPMSNSVSGPQLVEQVPYGNDMEKMQAFAIDFAHAHAGQTQDVLRLVGYCLLLKREVVDLIGGLDENYGSGNFEDDDLCLRSAIAGFRHVIARDVFVHHFGSMTFKGNAINYNATLEKNRTLFARKWSHIVTMKEGGYEASLQRQTQIGELLHWGEQRFAEGNLRWAAKLFERIQIMDPGNTQAMNNLGVIQWQLGNVESAIDIFQHALIIDPADTDALANLSQAVTETARIDILKTDLLETLRRVQPDSLDLKMLDAACRT